MTSQEVAHPHEKLLVMAGILTLFGLGIGIVYVLWSTPYTMVAFLGLGQMTILAGGVIFLTVILLDVKARLQSVVEKKFGPGETVFRQGEFPDRLYLIGKGEAEVIREVPGGEDIPLARLTPGEFFGEMGIMGNTPRSATVKAATELEALSIHRSYIGPMISYLPSWQEKIREEYAQRTAMNREAGLMDEGEDES
jgi:CRP/FNR family cyclic AMP-dependent transcriptional regulator